MYKLLIVGVHWDSDRLRQAKPVNRRRALVPADAHRCYVVETVAVATAPKCRQGKPLLFYVARAGTTGFARNPVIMLLSTPCFLYGALSRTIEAKASAARDGDQCAETSLTIELFVSGVVVPSFDPRTVYAVGATYDTACADRAYLPAAIAKNKQERAGAIGSGILQSDLPDTDGITAA